MTKLLSPIQRSRTISEEVEERLVLAIASGEQVAGSRLTEGSVAEAMGVSRVPAREAILSLAAKGLLTSAGARGLKVVDFGRGQAAKVREVRLALEAVAIRHAIAAVRADPDALRPLDEVLARMEQLTRAPSAIALAKCDLEFHRTILGYSRNDVLVRSWEALTPHLLVLFCKDWHTHPDGVGEVKLHDDLRTFISKGGERDIEQVLGNHFS